MYTAEWVGLMNYSDLPPDVKEAWDDKPEEIPNLTIGEIFDRWCDYNGMIHMGPKIRTLWLELQRLQSQDTRRLRHQLRQTEG